MLQKKLNSNRTSKIPDIALNSGFAYQNANHTEDGRFNGGAYIGASLVNIPLFYNYSPEIQNAALKLQQAELKYESAKNKAEKDVTSAYDKFLIAAENLNYYESKILTSSEELIEISKKPTKPGNQILPHLLL